MFELRLWILHPAISLFFCFFPFPLSILATAILSPHYLWQVKLSSLFLQSFFHCFHFSRHTGVFFFSFVSYETEALGFLLIQFLPSPLLILLFSTMSLCLPPFPLPLPSPIPAHFCNPISSFLHWFLHSLHVSPSVSHSPCQSDISLYRLVFFFYSFSSFIHPLIPCSVTSSSSFLFPS